MTHATYLKLVALSHDEELSPELRAAIRRELGDRGEPMRQSDPPLSMLERAAKLGF